MITPNDQKRKWGEPSLTIANLFIVIFLTKPLWDISEHLFGVVISPFYQYMNLSLVIATSILLFLKTKLRFSYLSLTFMVLGTIGIANGLMSNGMNTKTFANSYYYFMPAMMLMYGEFLQSCKIYELSKSVGVLFRRWHWVLVGYSLAFLVLHQLGLTKYSGWASGSSLTALFFPTLSLAFIFGMLGDITSEKRTAIVIVLILLVKRIGLMKLLLLAIVFWALISMVGYSVLPDKIKSLLTLSELNWESMYIISGGRSAEVYAITHKFAEEPVRLLTGLGFGYSYISYDIFNPDNYDVRHYSHFMPASYALLTGVFSPIIIYGFLIRVMYIGWVSNQSVGLIAACFVLSSLAGASLHVEPFPWIVFGYILSTNFRLLPSRLSA